MLPLVFLIIAALVAEWAVAACRRRRLPVVAIAPEVRDQPEKHGARVQSSHGAPASVQGSRMGQDLMRLTMNDVSFRIGQNQVLSGVRATLRHGELVALIGESGSGKTTLLNVLAGRASYGTRTGDITFNEQPFQPRAISLGFVPQAHLVFKELTVYENLLYTAKLRLDPNASAKERADLVGSTLELLGLTKVAHFSCDKASKEKLSGGQMRRVGIGAELVTRPSILMLDEPTSALDAVNTRLVVETLRMLANRGILVLASIHQPRFSVYQMLDRLLILHSGQLIYGGPRTLALPFFARSGYVPPDGENPADFFIEVAFGFVDCQVDPHVPPAELAAKWLAQSADEAAMEQAARPQGSCTSEAFHAWFVEAHGAVLSTRVAEAVWEAAQASSEGHFPQNAMLRVRGAGRRAEGATLAGAARAVAATAEIDWADLLVAMDTWYVRRSELPGAGRQFAACVQRYLLKMVHVRKQVLSNLLLLFAIGLLCGFLNGTNPSLGVQIMFPMLTGACFSCIVATTTIGTLGGSALEREFFRHEACCGTRQVAECLARLIIDAAVLLVPSGVVFALPLHGVTASHISEGAWVFLFISTAWAYTSLGYACDLLFPSAPAVANVAISFVLSSFFSGIMGMNPLSAVGDPGLEPSFAASGLDNDGYGLFAVMPGFWTITLQLLLIATEGRPFAISRSAMLGSVQSFGMVPGHGYSSTTEAEAAVLTYEVNSSKWYAAAVLSLWSFGLMFRLVALVIFVVRNWDLKSMWRQMLAHVPSRRADGRTPRYWRHGRVQASG